jgi:hypothetical protein
VSLDERVSARVRKVRPKSALKSAVASPFYLVGWLVGAVFFGFAWTWSAIAVGFSDGSGRTRREAEGGA